VFTVVLTLIAVNAASHLVEVGLLPVSVLLVVAVSAVAPLVLWRVHRLSEHRPEPVPVAAELAPEPVPVEAEPAEPITVERALTVSPIEDTPLDAAPAGLVLGPWTPVAELAGGTTGTQGGTGSDVPLSQWFATLPTGFEPAAKQAAEPVPPTVPPTGTGVEDVESEDSSNTTFEARVATVQHWLETEPELTGTQIGTRLDVSDGYGRRLLRKARGDS
jgi:hypothetical protein